VLNIKALLRRGGGEKQSVNVEARKTCHPKITKKDWGENNGPPKAEKKESKERQSQARAKPSLAILQKKRRARQGKNSANQEGKKRREKKNKKRASFEGNR